MWEIGLPFCTRRIAMREKSGVRPRRHAPVLALLRPPGCRSAVFRILRGNACLPLELLSKFIRPTPPRRLTSHEKGSHHVLPNFPSCCNGVRAAQGVFFSPSVLAELAGWEVGPFPLLKLAAAFLQFTSPDGWCSRGLTTPSPCTNI